MLESKEKVVAFAGHRDDWHCIGVEDKLPQVLEELIQKVIQFSMMAIMVLSIKSVLVQFYNLNTSILISNSFAF